MPDGYHGTLTPFTGASAFLEVSQDLVAAVDKCGEGEPMELTVYRYNYDLDGNLTSGYEELHLTLELQIID